VAFLQTERKGLSVPSETEEMCLVGKKKRKEKEAGGYRDGNFSSRLRRP